MTPLNVCLQFICEPAKNLLKKLLQENLSLGGSRWYVTKSGFRPFEALWSVIKQTGIYLTVDNHLALSFAELQHVSASYDHCMLD